MHATVNVTDSSEAVDIRNFINKKMVTVQREIDEKITFY